METKQTAVDFLIHEISDIIGIIAPDAFNASLIKIKYEQAKAMEKEQIINAYKDFHDLGHIYGLDLEKYYNETYGSQAPQRLNQANGN